MASFETILFFGYIMLCWGNTSWSSSRLLIECLQFFMLPSTPSKNDKFPICLDFSATLLLDDWEQAAVKRGEQALVFHKIETK